MCARARASGSDGRAQCRGREAKHERAPCEGSGRFAKRGHGWEFSDARCANRDSPSPFVLRFASLATCPRRTTPHPHLQIVMLAARLSAACLKTPFVVRARLHRASLDSDLGRLDCFSAHVRPARRSAVRLSLRSLLAAAQHTILITIFSFSIAALCQALAGHWRRQGSLYTTAMVAVLRSDQLNLPDIPTHCATALRRYHVHRLCKSVCASRRPSTAPSSRTSRTRTARRSWARAPSSRFGARRSRGRVRRLLH